LTTLILCDILWPQSEGKALPEILSEFNWIDILYIILLIGMVYRGAKTGVGGQLFSLAGWFVTLFISLKYYSFLSETISGFLMQRWGKPISFFLIAAIIFVAIKVFERVINIVNSEGAASIERMGGSLIASLRACILFGLIGILFLLTPVNFLRSSAIEGSKTCMFFVHMDVAIYSGITELIGLTSSSKETGGVEDKRTVKGRDEIIKEFLAAPTIKKPVR
jgi:uncharacterized membrane protein required for colicin V production